MRNLVALIYLSVVIWIAIISIQRGLSFYFVSVADSSSSNLAASKAVAFDSTNPDAYEMRGLLFLQKGNYREALGNFKSLIALQPNDYFSWVRLGYIYSKLNDFDNALNSYNKAVSLAPNYASPKRYLGELYLKNGNSELAFQNLSQAAAVDETLLPEVLQFAYKTFSGDAAAIENAFRPNSIKAKKQLAFYFIKRKIMSDGTKQFLTSDELDEETKDEFINLLIQDKNYPLALELWNSKDKTKNSSVVSNNLIANGGFEAAIDGGETGFGWKVNQKTDNVAVSLDNEEVYAGDKSIFFQFNGTSDPSNAILSQMSPVEPDQNYRLTFAGRAQDLVTGGLPVVSVIDADSKKVVGQSSAITARDIWQKYTIDFRTTNKMEVLIISVQRLNCNPSPCPAFGSLWFDDFELKKR